MKAPCGHEICGTCCKRTFTEVNGKCPLCRAVLPFKLNKYEITTRINFEKLNIEQIENIFPFICADGVLADVTQCMDQFDIDVNRPDSTFKIFPLFLSSQNGHFSIVKFLVQNGADVNKAHENGTTSLLLSSTGGHVSIVEILLENGADVNQARENGTTSLLLSSIRGHVSIVKILLENGADVNITGPNGLTSLAASIHMGNKYVTKLLRQHGAGKTI